MRCVLVIGRQGSGKGEQSDRIARRLGADHVSTGALLREAVRNGTKLGRQCEQQMVRGEPVADEIVAGVVAERLAVARAEGKDVVLDGYPRTVEQAERLAGLLSPDHIDLAIHLDVPRSIAVERLQQRSVCRVCHGTGRGATCSWCGGQMEHRADDLPAAIGRRMSEYMRAEGPLRAWFDSRGILVTVDGRGTPGEVEGRINVALERTLGTVH
jgi:adenylate kinase